MAVSLTKSSLKAYRGGNVAILDTDTFENKNHVQFSLCKMNDKQIL